MSSRDQLDNQEIWRLDNLRRKGKRKSQKKNYMFKK